MEPHRELPTSQDAAHLRAEAEWLRFQAEMADMMAANACELAAHEHAFQLELESRFPAFVSSPPVPPPSEPESSAPAVDLSLDRDIDAFIALATAERSALREPRDVPGEMVERQRAFGETWRRLTEPEAIFGSLMRPTLTDIPEAGPQLSALSNRSLQATVRPNRSQRLSFAPINVRGITVNPLGTEPGHLGHFSHLGNIRAEAGARELTVWTAHQLLPIFHLASGSGLGPPLSFRGRLHFWVELACEIAEVSSFLAPRPGTKPNAAFVRASSSLAYMAFNPLSSTPAIRGFVPLWNADSEWYPFLGGPVGGPQDRKIVARQNFQHIDTGEIVDLIFGGAAASLPFFYVGLVDGIVASNTPDILVYMQMRNLYRVKQVIIAIVA